MSGFGNNQLQSYPILAPRSRSRSSTTIVPPPPLAAATASKTTETYISHWAGAAGALGALKVSKFNLTAAPPIHP